MSSDTQVLIDLCEQLPEAERAEVADFARFLLSRREDGREDETPAHTRRHGIIRHTEGVVGGDARVRDTRIAVWTLVQFKKLGRNEAQLLADFPGLTQDDLDAVWAYYREYTDEIEKVIAAEAAEG